MRIEEEGARGLPQEGAGQEEALATRYAHVCGHVGARLEGWIERCYRRAVGEWELCDIKNTTRRDEAESGCIKAFEGREEGGGEGDERTEGLSGADSEQRTGGERVDAGG